MIELDRMDIYKRDFNKNTLIKSSTESEKLIPIISDLTIENTGEVSYR